MKLILTFLFSSMQLIQGGGGGGGGVGGGGSNKRPGTEKRCSHNLQSDPLGSGFQKGRENFPL